MESESKELYPGMCISRSLDLFKAQFSDIVVASLLVNIASWSVGSIPYFGILLTGAVNGVLYGGLYAYYLKLIRGQKVQIADAFAGFSPAFPQLMLAGLTTSVLTLCVMGLFALPFLLAVIPAVWMLIQDPDSAWPAFPGALALVALAVSLFAGFVLTVLWIFAVPLVMDKKLEFWPAMERSRKVVMRMFWKIAALALAAGLIGASGILLCGVGIFFTIPVAFGAIAYAYEDLFGAPG